MTGASHTVTGPTTSVNPGNVWVIHRFPLNVWYGSSAIEIGFLKMQKGAVSCGFWQMLGQTNLGMLRLTYLFNQSGPI